MALQFEGACTRICPSLKKKTCFVGSLEGGKDLTIERVCENDFSACGVSVKERGGSGFGGFVELI